MEDAVKFEIARNFYLNFGDEPERILNPIIRNEVIRVISSHSSLDFQQANVSISQNLENEIKNSLSLIVNRWSNITI